MLHPGSFGPPRTSYSPGVLAEHPVAILYLAGQTPTDGSGTVAEGDFVAQVHQVFANIGSVLAEAEMDFSNVVKFTNYLVDADDLPVFRAVRSQLWTEYFPDGALPADTLLVISRLARPEFRLEVEAVAVRC
jgi:enamine deaminase RidA (YjgF/YER057c/UK114 family)